MVHSLAGSVCIDWKGGCAWQDREVMNLVRNAFWLFAVRLLDTERNQPPRKANIKTKPIDEVSEGVRGDVIVNLTYHH